jgi:hypothetical protein
MKNTIKSRMIRNIVKKMLFFTIGVIFLFACMLFYSIYSLCEREEKVITFKGNNSIEIKIKTIDCGALSSQSHKVYLVKESLNIDKELEPFIHIEGEIPTFYWVNKYELLVKINSYNKVHSFSNIHYFHNIPYKIKIAITK